MRTALRWTVAALPVLLAAQPAAYATAPAAAAAAADSLIVFFTAETRGNLQPCSCPKRPLGGLARRVAFIREAPGHGSSRDAILRLDAGGFLPEGQVPLRDDPRVAARLVALLLDGLDAACIQATALDHRERAFLEKTAPRETARLAPALLEADPPGPPRRIRWGDRTVALLALEESSPDTVVLRAARQARARAQILIVLARADALSGRRLARLSQADLVLLSRGARPESVLYEGKTPLVGCGAEGREVGEVRLVPEAGGRGLRVVEFKLHAMDGSCPDDPEIAMKTSSLLRESGAAELLRARSE